MHLRLIAPAPQPRPAKQVSLDARRQARREAQNPRPKSAA
jgi:hypothetical protein